MKRLRHSNSRSAAVRLPVATAIAVFTSLSLGVTACETVVDIDFPEQDPAITVNSIFFPGYNFEVHLSEARGVVKNDRSLPSILNADVELYRNGEWVENLPHVGDGLYRSPSTRPAPGDEFEIRASAPGYEPAVAKDVVPQDVDVEFEYDDRQPARSQALSLTILLHDPPDDDNYYRLSAFYEFGGPNGLLLRLHGFHTDDDAVVAENVDPFDDSNAELNYVETAFFTDEHLEAGVHEIGIEVRAPEGINGWFQTVDVRLDVISKPFFDYATTYRKFETFRDNPFKEPVLVTNNVQNGYGLFAGFCQDRFFVAF